MRVVTVKRDHIAMMEACVSVREVFERIKTESKKLILKLLRVECEQGK